MSSQPRYQARSVFHERASMVSVLILSSRKVLAMKFDLAAEKTDNYFADFL